MTVAANILVGLVAVLHVWFLVLEMFLWRKPAGRRVSGLNAADAGTTAVLAANQGLYNGFLAAALFVSLVNPNPDVAHAMRLFGLVCVIIAGIYGSMTASRRIFLIQALPAVLALGCSRLS